MILELLRIQQSSLIGIAACCVRHKLPLLTLNVKDFDDFAVHDGLSLLRAPGS